MTMTMIPEVRAIRTNNINVAKDTSSPAQRLANVRSAKNDPAKREAYAIAERGVARLGYSLDDVASASGVAKLDEAMKRLNWTMDQRFNLKHVLATIGCIA
jgi:hypothetical protein